MKIQGFMKFNEDLFCECHLVTVSEIVERSSLGEKAEEIQKKLRVGKGCGSCLRPYQGNIASAVKDIMRDEKKFKIIEEYGHEF